MMNIVEEILSFMKTLILSSPFIIAFVTLLWYRRGRLWKFYYSVLDVITEQSILNSLDRKQWENHIKKSSEMIVSDAFGFLFDFEIEYIRTRLKDLTKYFWEANGESHSQPVVCETDILAQESESHETTDVAVKCDYRLRKLIGNELRWCGMSLFFKSLWQRIKKMNRNDSGENVVKHKRPLRNVPELQKKAKTIFDEIATNEVN